MSSEGEQIPRGEYELKVSGKYRVGKVSGSVGIAGDDLTGWRVEAFDDTGVRVLPLTFRTIEEADAFARGFMDGIDQGFLNCIEALAQVGAIDKSRIELLPQIVKEGPPDGNDD